MLTAFLFPGQGSQYIGMGKDLFEASDFARDIYEHANKILGFSLTDISFNGPEEKLMQTYITQPAIFVHSYILTQLTQNKITVLSVAGHSLGEFSALVYSGALSFEDGLKLVKVRGELMQKAGEQTKGTMAAIVGIESKILEQICKDASQGGIVKPANYNSPGQIVISGDADCVLEAMEMCKIHKARLVKKLPVHGAFHSPLMQPAAEEFKIYLMQVNLGKLNIPVYSNVTAKPIDESTSPDEIRDLLYRQLTSPVCWEESIINMINSGIDRFIEVGPGKVLQSLINKINPSVNTRGINTLSDLIEYDSGEIFKLK